MIITLVTSNINNNNDNNYNHNHNDGGWSCHVDVPKHFVYHYDMIYYDSM